jgi:SAM-dependent methyltransferase
MDIDCILGVEELRARLLRFTRRAYRLLPALDRPRILDIGCGQGLQTMELARLSGGAVVGIDIDLAALTILRRRIDETGTGDRITAQHVSLFDNPFGDSSFDVLWEEGVLHLLDASRSFAECRRLLGPGGHLVMHETLSWYDGIRKNRREAGFESVDRLLLPKRFWWTHYGAPLEERIRAFRKRHGKGPGQKKLAAHENVVAAIKRDPDQTNCGIYIVKAVT